MATAIKTPPKTVFRLGVGEAEVTRPFAFHIISGPGKSLELLATTRPDFQTMLAIRVDDEGCIVRLVPETEDFTIAMEVAWMSDLLGLETALVSYLETKGKGENHKSQILLDKQRQVVDGLIKIYEDKNS
ncbi:MAG: hypothetical protein WC045_02450 [Patescibacteria group bacterium]